MKRLTLTTMMFTAFAATTVAGSLAGQDPDRPPRPPRAGATPHPTPAPAPVVRVHPLIDIDVDAIREQALEAARAARGFSYIDTEEIRAQAREAAQAAREMSRIDMDQVREDARRAAEDARAMALDHRFDFRFDFPMAPTGPMAPLSPMPPMPAMAPFGHRGQSEPFPTHAPAPWAQGDPGDSLYRVAQQSLNQGDYRRAAQLFADVTTKFPRSTYAATSMYWEAFARYKIGTTDDLHAAAKALETLTSRTDLPRRNLASESEVAALNMRINGALAQRGDKDAAAKVAKDAAQAGNACDREDVAVRVEALNALGQMDPAAATPLLRRVLERKDDCSADLRRRAIWLLGRRADADAANLLIATAKSDPNVDVRAEAINWLPRMPGDAGLNALEELLRSDPDQHVQRAAVRALMSSDNPKARQSMRALIERKDANEALRIEAIRSYDRDHSTADDAAYLRGLYAKAETDQMKDAIISTVTRLGGTDSEQWVLSIARNTNESSRVRATALSRIGTNIPIGDLVKLYDSADSRSMRDQLISAFERRKEPEATDKLIDIVKNSTDRSARMTAINALTRKNDPRAQKLLFDLVDRPQGGTSPEEIK